MTCDLRGIASENEVTYFFISFLYLLLLYLYSFFAAEMRMKLMRMR